MFYRKKVDQDGRVQLPEWIYSEAKSNKPNSIPAWFLTVGLLVLKVLKTTRTDVVIGIFMSAWKLNCIFWLFYVHQDHIISWWCAFWPFAILFLTISLVKHRFLGKGAISPIAMGLSVSLCFCMSVCYFRELRPYLSENKNCKKWRM